MGQPNPEIYYHLAVVEADLGNLTTAKAQAEKALKLLHPETELYKSVDGLIASLGDKR